MKNIQKSFYQHIILYITKIHTEKADEKVFYVVKHARAGKSLE